MEKPPAGDENGLLKGAHHQCFPVLQGPEERQELLPSGFSLGSWMLGGRPLPGCLLCDFLGCNRLRLSSNYQGPRRRSAQRSPAVAGDTITVKFLRAALRTRSQRKGGLCLIVKTRPSEEPQAAGCQAGQVAGHQEVDARTNVLPGKAPAVDGGTGATSRAGPRLTVSC